MLVSCKFFVALLASLVPHYIPQVKSANLSLKMQVGTRPVRTQHKDNSFHGKRNIAKFTRSTIWGVQLKSGDN
jgi:hypothetical protein